MSERAASLVRKEPGPETSSPVDVTARSVALAIIASATVMAALFWARSVFIPIVLGILISYALDPIVLAFMRLRLSRVIASAVVMVLVSGSLGYMGYSLSDDAAAVVAEIPAAAVELRRAMRRGRDDGSTLTQVQKAADELQRTADEAAGPNQAPAGVQRVQIEEPAIDVREYLSWGSAGLLGLVGEATLVIFFVFFLLASGDLFKRKLVKLAGPSLERKKITVQILNEIDSQISKFLLVRAVTSVIVGLLTWLAFWWVGLGQAAFWGFAAGLFNSIPYFGPVIVAAATFVVAFLQFGTVAMGIYVSGISLAITTLEGWLLTPWLTSRTARTNEVAMFVGLIVFGFLWGIWGTLLAVPMLVAVKAFCDRIDDLKPFGELLGE